METLEKQLKFFEDHKNDLLKKYKGEFIVISDDLVISSFGSLGDAYKFGVKEYGLGHFLLKECASSGREKINIITPSVVVYE